MKASESALEHAILIEEEGGLLEDIDQWLELACWRERNGM